jgi:hypothetical protein
LQLGSSQGCFAVKSALQLLWSWMGDTVEQ